MCVNEEQFTMTNYYHCTHCDLDWDSDWDCEVEEECPECGTVYTPMESVRY